MLSSWIVITFKKNSTKDSAYAGQRFESNIGIYHRSEHNVGSRKATTSASYETCTLSRTSSQIESRIA